LDHSGEPDDRADPFTHGVGSFDPTTTSVLLWTRVEGHDTVRWSIAPATDVAPVAGGEVVLDPDANGSVAVDVDDLLPGTSYRYWFEAGDRRSPVGRTRTLPDAGVDRVRLAVVCCADYSQGHFGVYRAVADAQVDLVVHVGDYIYESAGRGTVRTAEPDRTVTSLDDYRTRFAQTRSDPDMRALHQRHPMVAIWDDHDIADNAWRHGAKAHDDAQHGLWEERLSHAVQAWHEWLPTRLRDPGDQLAIWRSFPIGDLAELVMLDTRIAGRDEHADHPGSPDIDDPDRSILGAAQRPWAHERVRDTSRPWCLLGSAVVLNRMQLPVPVGERLSDVTPSGYAVVDGQALCTDEWDGYPTERERLVAAMADRGGGMVVISGDVHSAWAFEGPNHEGRPVAVEFVAPCVTSTPMGAQLPRGWRKLAGELAETLPEARWFELERHGFVVLDVDRERVRADWFTVDIEDPHARAHPAAAWLNRLDEPGRLHEASDVPAAPRAPAGSPAATAPQVAVPDRPAELTGGDAAAARRRTARIVAGGALVTAIAGLWHRQTARNRSGRGRT